MAPATCIFVFQHTSLLFKHPFGFAGGGCRGTTTQLLAATLCSTHRFVQDLRLVRALLLGQIALLRVLLLC